MTSSGGLVMAIFEEWEVGHIDASNVRNEPCVENLWCGPASTGYL